MLPPNSLGHGDLLMHEVRLDEHDIIIHELHFSQGGVFEIFCKTFTHRLELLS